MDALGVVLATFFAVMLIRHWTLTEKAYVALMQWIIG